MLECDILPYYVRLLQRVLVLLFYYQFRVRVHAALRALEYNILLYATLVCYRIRRKALGFSQALGW